MVCFSESCIGWGASKILRLVAGLALVTAAVSPSTAFRWMMRGLSDGRGKRIRLQAVRRGKIWLTSRAALERFLSALPHSQSESTPTAAPIRTPSKRERDSARAEQTLKNKYGI